MDHYRTLQVSRHAESEVIDKAYRVLSLKNHPDVTVSSKRDSATVRMQRINRAYAVLSDPVARRRYDATLGHDSGRSAWDTFMRKGLIGMFLEKAKPPSS
ncbi:MAG: J domain-containing protein [Actinobacteria bacterium]|nr:J domain-containing protein [Actinomycetota bacterium]MCG2806999.1 J domain-containing protein [Coriobacteriia bacterium]